MGRYKMSYRPSQVHFFSDFRFLFHVIQYGLKPQTKPFVYSEQHITMSGVMGCKIQRFLHQDLLFSFGCKNIS